MSNLHIISIITLILLAFQSCKPNKTEQSILDYRQTVGKTKTDLSMKIIKLERQTEITAKDSFEIIKGVLKKKAEKIIEVNNEYLTVNYPAWIQSERENLAKTTNSSFRNSTIGLINRYEERMNEAIVETEALKQDYFKGLQMVSKNIKKSEDDELAHLYMDSILRLHEYYKHKGNQILAIVYNCLYSIKNPELNNVKQEIEDKFLLTPDNKVICIIP